MCIYSYICILIARGFSVVFSKFSYTSMLDTAEYKAKPQSYISSYLIESNDDQLDA